MEDYVQTILDADDTADVTVEVVSGNIVLTGDSNDNIVRSGDTELFRAAVGLVNSLQVRGTTNNDTITVDFTGGLALPRDGLVIAGDAGVNVLVVLGNGSLNLTDPNITVTDISSIEIQSSSTHRLTLNAAAIDRLSSTNKEVTIKTTDGTPLVPTDFSGWRMDAPIIVSGGFLLTAINSVGGQVIRLDTSLVYRNFVLPGDVNNSGGVSASDAIEIILELNLRQFSDSVTGTIQVPQTVRDVPGIYFDRSGDGRVSALDALLVINDLVLGNIVNGESEFIQTDFLRNNPSVSHLVSSAETSFNEQPTASRSITSAADMDSASQHDSLHESTALQPNDERDQAVDELLTSSLSLEDWLLLDDND